MKHKSFLSFLVISLVSLSSLNSSFAAPPKPITITGIVSDLSTHLPIEGVKVYTRLPRGLYYEAFTDVQGRYTLIITPTTTRNFGAIVLYASKKNYLTSIKVIPNPKHGRTYKIDFLLRDITPPSTPKVTDDGAYTNSLNTLHASWLSEDKESGIKGYLYSVGTHPGSSNIKPWTSAGKNIEVTLTNLKLIHATTYYFNVRAINGINLISKVGSSDGIMVNAHIPEITRVIPFNNSTFHVGDNVTVEVSAQDLDSDPIQYQFSTNNQILQPFSSQNTYTFKIDPSPTNTITITIEVKDDKGGLVSENVTYNIQNTTLDTTPPTAPVLTTGSTSDSLNSITAQWTSEDPESGIAEYQYAIGTTPGGTDVVYWTTYGNNTQAYLSGLDLTKGQDYYLSALAKNGAGLKSPITTSSPIRADKELYVKINYPYQNAIITEHEVQIKGVAEGVSQLTINGKPVTVNGGGFIGPTLIAPGYAARQNIDTNDPNSNYILMNPSGQTIITASVNGSDEDSVSVYYYQTFVTSESQFSQDGQIYTTAQSWNPDSQVECPFKDPNNIWTQLDKQSRIFGSSGSYYQNNDDPYNMVFSGLFTYSYFYQRVTEIDDKGVIIRIYEFRKDAATNLTFHTPPAIDGEVRPIVILFRGLGLLYNPELYSQVRINGQPLKKLYANCPNWPYGVYYITLENYPADTNLNLTVENVPVKPFGSSSENSIVVGETSGFEFSQMELLFLDAVREVPYNSGNYVSVKTLPIFQPDDGKGRGPSMELVNMPFLKVKFNEVPSNLQINTLQATLTIAEDTKTYGLTETADDSSIFTEPTNSFTVKLDPIPDLDPNAQDELTCFVTSSFGNLDNKIFNLKESASDSLYFNDIKTFVTIIFNQELLPYQNDTLTIQYENGMLASEETLTETAPDSLIFANADNILTVKLNNYQGTMPDTLDINIPNTDYLELSNPRLALAKANDNPYVYTNEPLDGGSDLPPNNPLDEGQGVFRIRVRGLPKDLPSNILSSLQIELTTEVESKILNLTQQPDGLYVTNKLVPLPQNDNTTYDGITSFRSTSGDDKIKLEFEVIDANTIYKIMEELKNVVKPAFVGAAVRGFTGFPYWWVSVTNNIPNMRNILHNRLGYPVVGDGRLTKQDVLNALPNHSVWYSLAHGATPDGTARTPFKAFVVYESEIWNGKKAVIKPEDIAAGLNGNKYNLVFLNSCLSADERIDSATDAFKVAFDARAYLGWTQNKYPSWAAVGAEKFFIELDGKRTIEFARREAIRKYPVCQYLKPLGITDDTNIIDLK